MAAAQRCRVCYGPMDGDSCPRCAAGPSWPAADEAETSTLVRAYVLRTMPLPPPRGWPEVVDGAPRSRPDARWDRAEAGEPDPPDEPSMVVTVEPGVDDRRDSRRLSRLLITAVPLALLPLLVAVFVLTPRTWIPHSLGESMPSIDTDAVGSLMVVPPTDVTDTGIVSVIPTPTESPSASPPPTEPSSTAVAPHRPVLPTTPPHATTPAPTSAPPPTARPQGIVGLGGLCVTDANGGMYYGNQVQLARCDGGGAQQWTFGADGTVRALGLCLAPSYEYGQQWARVVVWPCNGSASETWSQQPYGELVNAQSGLCLDDPYGSTTPGTQLQTYPCHEGDNQQWTIYNF